MYLFFLILFSYMLLCVYGPISGIQESEFQANLGLKISPVEILLIIWRFSYICVMLKYIGHEVSQ